MQGAGGVGDLLLVTDHSALANFFPTYDGNGNVSEYLDSTGTVQAHYEYDPFGRTTVATGTKAQDFAHRFSTKPLDAETGLYYYGYRYYDPVTGRWPSRDPIGERGGVNLYGFVTNVPVGKIDLLGKDDCSLSELGDKKVISARVDLSTKKTPSVASLLYDLVSNTITGKLTELQSGFFTHDLLPQGKATVVCGECKCTRKAGWIRDAKYEWVEKEHSKTIRNKDTSSPQEGKELNGQYLIPEGAIADGADIIKNILLDKCK